MSLSCRVLCAMLDARECAGKTIHEATLAHCKTICLYLAAQFEIAYQPSLLATASDNLARLGALGVFVGIMLVVAAPGGLIAGGAVWVAGGTTAAFGGYGAAGAAAFAALSGAARRMLFARDPLVREGYMRVLKQLLEGLGGNSMSKETEHNCLEDAVAIQLVRRVAEVNEATPDAVLPEITVHSSVRDLMAAADAFGRPLWCGPFEGATEATLASAMQRLREVLRMRDVRASLVRSVGVGFVGQTKAGKSTSVRGIVGHTAVAGYESAIVAMLCTPILTSPTQ